MISLNRGRLKANLWIFCTSECFYWLTWGISEHVEEKGDQPWLQSELCNWTLSCLNVGFHFPREAAEVCLNQKLHRLVIPAKPCGSQSHSNFFSKYHFIVEKAENIDSLYSLLSLGMRERIINWIQDNYLHSFTKEKQR